MVNVLLGFGFTGLGYRKKNGLFFLLESPCLIGLWNWRGGDLLYRFIVRFSLTLAIHSFAVSSSNVCLVAVDGWLTFTGFPVYWVRNGTAGSVLANGQVLILRRANRRRSYHRFVLTLISSCFFHLADASNWSRPNATPNGSATSWAAWTNSTTPTRCRAVCARASAPWARPTSSRWAANATRPWPASGTTALSHWTWANLT